MDTFPHRAAKSQLADQSSQSSRLFQLRVSTVRSYEDGHVCKIREHPRERSRVIYPKLFLLLLLEKTGERLEKKPFMGIA